MDGSVCWIIFSILVNISSYSKHRFTEGVGFSFLSEMSVQPPYFPVLVSPSRSFVFVLSRGDSRQAAPLCTSPLGHRQTDRLAGEVAAAPFQP